MAVLKTSGREYFNKRLGGMRTERSSFIAHAKDLSKHIQPRRGRFFTSDRNRGGARHQAIVNSHGTYAHRTAKTGLFAGVMNPARPWFRFTLDDKDLLEFGPVKVWLGDVEELMRKIFNAGNLYRMAPTLFGEMLLFATGAMLHVDDFDDVARFYTQTFGSYFIGQDQRQKVTTLVREFEMTAGNMVKQFGEKKVSDPVKRNFDNGNYETWHKIIHFIEPNPDFDPRRPESQFKSFRSIKYQPDVSEDKFLSKRGFDRFPGYVPRWETTGEDVYGTDCPCMLALGDIKGLQIEEKGKAKAIEKMHNPALKGPASLRNVPISSIPGDATLYDLGTGQEKLTPIYQVTPQIQELMLDIEKIERRIDQALFVDLFLAISSMEGIQPKNMMELAQRNEERLVQLGPVLGSVHGDFLEPLIDSTFEQMIDADSSSPFGILPEPPLELQNQNLNVTFISMLAQAQHAVATGNITRLADFVGSLAQGYETVLDKFDADQAVDEFGHLTGAPARLVVPDDQVAERRQARAEQEQQQRQQDMMLELAKSGMGPAANLGQADLSQDTPVSRAVENVQKAIGSGGGQTG